MSYEKIKQCIRNIVRLGIKKSDGETSVDGKIITVNVEYLGKTQEALLFIPWGTHVKLPDTDVVTTILQQEAHEDSLVAIPADIKNVDTLSGTEGLSYGIPSKKDRLIFKDTGKIVFKIGDVEGGDYMARFNELKSGFDSLRTDLNTFITTYNTHTHGDVQPGSGNTGNPSATGTPSTASIDTAKIDNIEVPL